MSAYGGGQVNKPRVMLAEEGEYDEDGIYATNDGERNAKFNGVRKYQNSNGGYNRGTTARLNRNIMSPCPCGGDHKTGWDSIATCGHFREQTVSERRKLVRKKDICPKCLKSMQRIKHKEVSECKWKNCDNCQQAHPALLCDKPRGSQAVMKASYETHDGDDQDNADEDDDSYFRRSEQH